jgi:hypothetical protein
MDLYFPVSNNRFPMKLSTDPARHIVCQGGDGPALSVIPQATSSEGITGTALPLRNFYSTLKGALGALAGELNTKAAKIGIEIQKLRDEGFRNGYMLFKLGGITEQVASGKMTYAEAEAAYTKALGSEVIAGPEESPAVSGTTATIPKITGFTPLTPTTPKKRREPKPAAKSVAEIMG